jgi:hypothetical protein
MTSSTKASIAMAAVTAICLFFLHTTLEKARIQPTAEQSSELSIRN